MHYTTREYFDKECSRLFEDAEIDISTACLTYLSYDLFTEFPSEGLVSETLRSHPFLGYAAFNWVFHVACIEPTVPVWSRAVTCVNDSERILFSSMVLRKLLLRSRSYSRLTEGDIRARERSLPPEYASECGHMGLAIFLLSNSEDSKAALDDSLHCALSEGHVKLVRLLIESGAKVKSLSADSSNALQKACKGGHLEVTDS